MRRSKKLISVILAVIMALGVLTVAPVTVSAASCVKTQSEALSWLNSQEGARYDLDGAYGSQCSDFSSAYINYILYGNPHAGKFRVYNARDYSNKNLYPSDWQVIKNTPSFLPQPGDIFVTKGTTSFGHTGVVISSTVNNAKIADQNGMGDWSLDYGSPAHIHNITWTGSGTWCATYYIRPSFASNAPHTHNYNTYVYYWKSHPHYKCYKCSCGDIKEDRNQPTFLPDCEQCNPSVDLGCYFDAYIKNANNKVVAVNNGNAVIKTKQNSGYQKWHFARQADLSYKITNLGTGTCLDVSNAGTNNGTNIQVYADNGTHAQRWYIKRNGNDGYALVPQCAKSCALDLANNDSTDGTNIQLYQWNGTVAQKYRFDVVYEPDSVKLNQNSLTLGVGESYKLTQKIIPSLAKTNCTWSSSNQSVATVRNGKVTAQKSGTANITVKTSNGKVATCKIKVMNTPKRVKLNPTRVTIRRGKKYIIRESTNRGSYANAANLKWSTSNSRVATVKKGSGNKAIITAKSRGTAYIKITLYNKKTAKCKVRVK